MAFSYPHNFHRFFIAYDIPMKLFSYFIRFLPFHRFFIGKKTSSAKTAREVLEARDKGVPEKTRKDALYCCRVWEAWRDNRNSTGPGNKAFKLGIFEEIYLWYATTHVSHNSADDMIQGIWSIFAAINFPHLKHKSCEPMRLCFLVHLEEFSMLK